MRKAEHKHRQKVLIALLKDARRRAGFRQQELAKALGYPQSFVSKYESGERRLDIIELREICDAMGISFLVLVKKLVSQLDQVRD